LLSSKGERSTGFASQSRVGNSRRGDDYRTGSSLPGARVPSQQTIFFCSIVCLSGEKIVAVSQINYDLLGSHVPDSGCVVASVSGELSPMLAAVQDPAHR
jgi:hypothetical protein